MKKCYNVFSLFFVLLFFTLFSCQIGLGDAIDLQAPEVVLTSHKDNDYVGQTFRLAGYATDNEKVKSITIDFDEADIHYKWENSTWQKKTSYIDWTALTADECTCTVNNATVNWEVTVNTTEAKVGMQSSTYSYSIVAQDQIGNSGKTSKIEGSLVVDQNTPDIKLNSPTLFSTNKDIQEKLSSFKLKDGSVLSQLFNGTLVFEGRQDSAAAFKEFRLELDDGTEDSNIVDSYNYDKPINSVTTENISNAYPFGRKTLYYSKTLKVGQDGIQDLRTWTVSINPEDWISSELNAALQSGKHQIRLVATSVSNSDAWQRKILGYFTWYPEADNPWITLYSGSESLETASSDQTYPSAKIFGVVQDDDGIESLTYSLEKQNADASWSSIKSNETLTLTEKNAKNSQWNIEAPTESAIYKLSVNVKDIYGKPDSVVKYFNVLDVQPPKISLTSPTESTTVFSAGGTAIKFAGTISDDAKIKSIKIVHLNPKAINPLENKLKFINHAEADWQKTIDSDGNLIFNVAIPKENYDSTTKIFSYEVNKSFDLFADLKIGADKPLITQDFVILAVDESGGATTLPISVVGDSDSPKLTITEIELFDDSNRSITKKNFANADIVELPPIKDGYSAKICGTWSDNSTTQWNDCSKINKIEVEWLKAEFSNVIMNSDGTWEVSVNKDTVPPSGSADSIIATLKDYANNSSTTSQSVMIERAQIGLDSITCENYDGSYTVGQDILINLEFTKGATFEAGTPSLKLNNGQYALYYETEKIKNGMSKIQFKYTISADDTNGLLDVESIEGDCKWKDTNTDAYFSIDNFDKIPKLSARKIKVDTIRPKIDRIDCITAPGTYKEGSILTFKIVFDEDVEIDNPNEIKLQFDGNILNSDSFETTQVGSNTLFSKYTINSNDDTTSLKITGITNTTVKDSAENSVELSLLEGLATDFSNIKIDTIKPIDPEITLKDKSTNKTFNVNDVNEGDFLIDEGDVFIDENAGFSINISSSSSVDGDTLYYSFDEGSSWKTHNPNTGDFTDDDTFNKNGTHRIWAYQEDEAGNKSETVKSPTFIINRGALIRRITAEQSSGTYVVGDTIKGYIEFRDQVEYSDLKVKLNVVGLDSSPISLSALNNEYKSEFEYTIQEGHKLNDGETFLEVKEFVGNVTYRGQSKTLSVTDDIKLSKSREIKIETVKPVIQSAKLLNSDSLQIESSKSCLKGSGNIELAISEEDFLIPTVLTESEYNDILVKIPTLEKYYKPGVNGATKNDDNTLTPDTTTKYILDFEINNDGSVPNTQSEAYSLENLKELFISKGLNKVVIPMYSSAVSVTESSIIVDLTGEYKLPVKGAEYSIRISAGAVKDSVGNTNDEYKSEGKLLAPGVEKPEIRIQKNGYTIKNSSADYSDALQASVKFSCRTPNASVEWVIKKSCQDGDKEKKVNDCNYHDTKTDDVKIEWNENDKKTDSSTTLGDTETEFNKVFGYKYAIMARPKIGSTLSEKEIAYEYAARTVLKFEVDSDAYKSLEGDDLSTDIKEGTTSLTVSQLKVWVLGGDSQSGDNTLPIFPLSRGDKASNFKLMKKDSGTSIDGKWYWITWDLSAPAYHCFAVGDVPSDAQVNGPKTWYEADGFNVPLAQNYILYPGETLRMQHVGSNRDAGGNGPFYFRLAKKGTRPLVPGETE